MGISDLGLAQLRGLKMQSSKAANSATNPMSTKSQAYVPPDLGLRLARRVMGLMAFFFSFYLGGHYLLGFSFPTPGVLLQIGTSILLGSLLGLVFSRFWPLPPKAGLERVIRTVLLVIPAVGFGLGLQIALQGPNPTQALYLVFALSAWLSSGLIVRLPEAGQNSPSKPAK